jgi:hypothetical protein
MKDSTRDLVIISDFAKGRAFHPDNGKFIERYPPSVLIPTLKFVFPSLRVIYMRRFSPMKNYFFSIPANIASTYISREERPQADKKFGQMRWYLFK